MIRICGQNHGLCDVLVYTDNGGLTRNARTKQLHTCNDEEITMEEVLGTPKLDGSRTKIQPTFAKENTVNTFTLKRKPSSIPAQNLLVGQIGIITAGGEARLNGQPLIRAYNGFVLLTDATHTWDDGDGFTVELLTAGDTVTLTIGDPALDAKILNHLQQGNKILAIKARRIATGEGLVEAKKYVDQFEGDARASGKLIAPALRW